MVNLTLFGLNIIVGLDSSDYIPYKTWKLMRRGCGVWGEITFIRTRAGE